MELIHICIYVAGALCTVGSSILAFAKGKSKKKETAKLTEVEQREDLRKVMVSEIKTAEKQGKMFSMAMSKTEIAEWKHSTVLKNLRLYALGNSYSWFVESEWGEKIKDFISDTKEVNAK